MFADLKGLGPAIPNPLCSWSGSLYGRYTNGNQATNESSVCLCMYVFAFLFSQKTHESHVSILVQSKTAHEWGPT